MSWIGREYARFRGKVTLVKVREPASLLNMELNLYARPINNYSCNNWFSNWRNNKIRKKKFYGLNKKEIKKFPKNFSLDNQKWEQDFLGLKLSVAKTQSIKNNFKINTILNKDYLLKQRWTWDR